MLYTMNSLCLRCFDKQTLQCLDNFNDERSFLPIRVQHRCNEHSDFLAHIMELRSLSYVLMRSFHQIRDKLCLPSLAMVQNLWNADAINNFKKEDSKSQNILS